MSNRIDQLKSLLQTHPADAFCLYGLAMEHAKLGRHEEAIQWYDRVLEVDPNYCYAYFHKAKSQEESGNVDGARQTLGAGLQRARTAGDMHAASEIGAYLEDLG